MRTLLIGIGNNLRGDDALGWLFLNEIEKSDAEKFHLEYRYQLQVEDADLISKYERVVFVDATEEPLDEGFAINRCESAGSYYYSSHMQSPETVLYLSKTLYPETPEAFVVTIRGYHWELGEKVSSRAMAHLEKALKAIRGSDLFKKVQVKEFEPEGVL